MRRRHFAARLPVYALALLLAFKAGVPMLASVAAAAQGRPVGEICSVYGVVLPAPSQPAPAHGGDDPHAHHHAGHGATTAPADAPTPSDPAGRHGADHCALTALAALAGGSGEPANAVAAFAAARAAPPPSAVLPGRDGAARWVAGLGHGPPASS